MMLRIEGSAEHSRCTCVHRPSRSPDGTILNTGFCVQSLHLHKGVLARVTELAQGRKSPVLVFATKCSLCAVCVQVLVLDLENIFGAFGRSTFDSC